MIYSFFDFLDEKEEAIKNMFKQTDISQPDQPCYWLLMYPPAISDASINI